MDMTVGIIGTILIAVLAALPGTFLSIWAWFKAHAAETEASWDDEAVALVERVAQGIVDANKPKA